MSEVRQLDLSAYDLVVSDFEPVTAGSKAAANVVLAWVGSMRFAKRLCIAS